MKRKTNLMTVLDKLSSNTVVVLSREEQDVLQTGLSYYRDTLTLCSSHEEGEHGDETTCEGWGPHDLATLDGAIGKVLGE